MQTQLIAPQEYNITDEWMKSSIPEDRLAIVSEKDEGTVTTRTYGELRSSMNKIGNAFSSLGLKKGDVILLLLPRGITSYEVYGASLKLGLVIIPSSEMLREKDILYRIEHSGAKAIIVHDQFANAFLEMNLPDTLIKCVVGGHTNTPFGHNISLLMEAESSSWHHPKTDKEDLAFLSYTSGTTGNPKAVMHTHSWGYAHIRTAASGWMGIRESDRVWATAGPGWQKWIWSPFLSVLGSGATGYLYEGKFDPYSYLTFLKKHAIQVLCCTPTEYRLMAKDKRISEFTLPHLRSAVSAGEPLNMEVIHLFKRLFNVNVRDGYGQTENTLLLGFMEDTPLLPGAMGKPTPGNWVEVVDEDGTPCLPGEVGHIAVHKSTPALFKGYLNDEERTERQYRGDFYLTGDKARRDEEGYFWFEGRSDDIIISSGYTIGPFEVEDALTQHPAVQECAVIASPDPDRGNIVKAYVVLVEQQRMAEQELVKLLQNHVKELTAPYKYPRKIEFVRELPKTTSGKIRRVELRKWDLETLNQ